MWRRNQRAQSDVVRVVHAVRGDRQPVLAVMAAIQIKAGVMLENLLRLDVVDGVRELLRPGAAVGITEQRTPFEAAEVEPAAVLAHAPEVAVEEVVEAGQIVGQRLLIALRRLARIADQQVPLAVRVNADQFRRRRSDLVLPVDAAALNAAADIERVLERIHAEYGLIQWSASGAAVDDLFPSIRRLAVDRAAPDLVARHLRAARLHRKAGGSGSEAQSQSDPLSWGVCPEPSTPLLDNTGQARQGEQDQGIRGTANACRTARRHEQGTTAEVGVQHRYRDLPGLRWPRPNHRQILDDLKTKTDVNESSALPARRAPPISLFTRPNNRPIDTRRCAVSPGRVPACREVGKGA